jgi:hypothetical protein
LEAIDKELAKTTFADKMTVLYAPGILLETIVSWKDVPDLQQMVSSIETGEDTYLDKDPVLYITGPDLVREPNRLGLTATSSLGLATTWYLSIYPFVLNYGIEKRLDEELKLLEGGLQLDFSWLTDLSGVLFVSFIGLQLVHEVAHLVVASMYGVRLSVPTFVPSLITGITSSVTTFKTLPKNKNAMFDISVAGPLAGIAASSAALALGSRLTLVSDPSTLPALPLEILRQSTLGGAIINQMIPGALYLPEGAPVSGMVGLHPLAIAGYISLVINALNLLPIGSKYTISQSRASLCFRMCLRPS